MACLGDITRHLPGLDDSSYKITSDKTDHYNCVAWAVGEDDRWWSHDLGDDYFWPDEAPRRESADAYRAMFALFGFQECDSGALEPGREKIAIFADEGQFTHVARQLPSGRWTSKLGEDCDIEHDLNDLTRRRSPFAQYRYGDIVAFMRRPTAPTSRAPDPPTGG